MTWLKGTTTWGSLEHLLAQLACGEVADGSSTTVAAASKWVREESRTVTDGVLNSTTTVTSATAGFTAAADVGLLVIGTGVTPGTYIASVTNSTTAVLSAPATASASGVTLQFCTNTIRTPAAKDVNTGACSNRAGYFANCGSGGQYNLNGSLGTDPARNSVCKVTSVATAAPSNLATPTFNRWIVFIQVTTANTVSGNYSTAQVTINVGDPDTVNSGNSSYGSSSTGNALSAAGVLSSTLYLGAGMALQLSDPSGFLTVGTTFARAFSTTYGGGIDLWPMWHRAATTTPSFTVNPPGAAGTDYDVISSAGINAIGGVSGWTGVTSSTMWTNRANWFHGLGIKTNAGLGSGALYTASFPMAYIKMRMFASSGGVLSLDLGQSRRDPLTPTIMRNVGGLRVTTWCKMATTAGSVTASTALQYWMSVTNDGIVLVINMDTSATGKLGMSFVCSYTPQEPTYDVFPVMFNHGISDFAGGVTPSQSTFPVATQYSYLGLRRRQDGSEGSRDWQTKWMRCEPYYANNTSVTNVGGPYSSGSQYGPYHSGSNATDDSVPCTLPTLGISAAYNNVYNQTPSVPARQVKPAYDSKWWLYPTVLGEGAYGNQNSYGLIVDENRFIRGIQSSRFLYIPADGWGNGDELTDTATSAKYLLLMPDYCPYGVFRFSQQASTGPGYGGVAVLET